MNKRKAFEEFFIPRHTKIVNNKIANIEKTIFMINAFMYLFEISWNKLFFYEDNLESRASNMQLILSEI